MEQPGPSVRDLIRRFGGVPIPRCPGRFILRDAPRMEGPQRIWPHRPITHHDVPSARDHVVVMRLADGGLISYSRADGSWVHTANTQAGFRRKLADLGISAQAD